MLYPGQVHGRFEAHPVFGVNTENTEEALIGIKKGNHTVCPFTETQGGTLIQQT